MKIIFSLIIALSSVLASAEQICGTVKKVKSFQNHQTIFELYEMVVLVKSISVHPSDWSRVSPLVLAALGNPDLRLCVDTQNMEIQVTNPH